MEHNSKRKQIRSIADRYERFLGPGPHSPEKTRILKALRRLNVEFATPEGIAEIIGNDSWTWLYCHECRQNVSEVVRLGNAEICPSCLQKAMELVEQES